MKIVDFLLLLKPLGTENKDKIDLESYFISIIMQAQFELDCTNGGGNSSNNNKTISAENQPECLQILKAYYKDIVYAPPELQFLQISMLDYYSFDTEVQKHKAILKKHSVEWNERLQTASPAFTVKPQHKTLSQVIITNNLSSESSYNSNNYSSSSTQRFSGEMIKNQHQQQQQQIIDRYGRIFSNNEHDQFISSSSSHHIDKSRYGTSNYNKQTMTSNRISEELDVVQKVTSFLKQMYQKYAFMTPYVVLMLLSCTAVIVSLKISSHPSSTRTTTGKKNDDTIWNQFIQLVKSAFGYP